MNNKKESYRPKGFWEWVFFILLNIFGSPLGFIIGAVIAAENGFNGWWGVLGSIIIFAISWIIWKANWQKDAKLSINPSISWGGKSYSVFKDKDKA